MKMNEAIEVEVLLATFNGARYIAEFLDSLIAQEGVRIHLRISDDGSTDETLVICRNYQDKLSSLKIETGPKAGPAANFYSLLRSAELQYIAFADQDDIWLPNHLRDSIRRLQKSGEKPALTFAAVNEFATNSPKSSKIWPPRFPTEDIREILTWNPARGCTIVLNKKAARIINDQEPKLSLMHDWWALLSIFTTGEVTWSVAPEIKYRLHDSNTVGVPSSKSKRLSNWLGNLRSPDWPLLEQAQELLDVHGENMPLAMRANLQTWCLRLSSKSIMDKFRLFLYSGRYRGTLLDEAMVRLTFLLLPIRRLIKP